MEDIVKDMPSFEEDVREDASSSPYGYDPVKDLNPVDPYGYVDLRSAFENHNVPSEIADELANYNGIDDPESILGTPKDIFEAYRMNDRIQQIDREVSSLKEDKTS